MQSAGHAAAHSEQPTHFSSPFSCFHRRWRPRKRGYSGRFASYYMAEYLNVVTVSAFTVTLFLGGWLMPFGIHPPNWVDPFIVLFKMSLITFLFIWVRATLPRLRYDQLMSFGWKILLPVATINALVTALVVVWAN